MDLSASAMIYLSKDLDPLNLREYFSCKSITAPLASAITARDLFQHKNPNRWNQDGIYFKSVWGIVLLTGLGFGLAGFKPIPAIIAAQALNGLILPFISVFLWIAINNANLMGKNTNSKTQNLRQ